MSILLFATALTACKKDSNGDGQSNTTTASLSFNNGLATLGKLDFYVNGTKKTSLDGTLHSDYSETPEGKMTIKVTNSGATATLATADFTLSAGHTYSVYVCGIATAPILVLSEDILSSPTTNSGKIRLVNLSAGTKGLDLNVRGKQAVFSNLAHKIATGFENMAAANEVSFDLRENGSSQVLSSLEKVKIEKDKIYTIIATGDRTENSSNVKLAIITNK